MAEQTLATELRRALPGLTLLENEPMAAHCTFRTGGPAALFAQPADEEQVRQLLDLLRARGCQPVIIGNGSNLLVRDGGIRGVVVHMGPALGQVHRQGNCLAAGAGITLARLAVYAREQGLSGLEFAHGIPGSLGGAVMMNAGAYGGEMAGVVRSVRYLDTDGQLRETADPGFAYRHSRFEDSGALILGATVALEPAEPEAIQQRMQELWQKRSASQPLDRPSAGSTFKRPAQGYAAAMIDQAGCKGLRVGGAQVSEKHAGFIINAGGAKSADVLALMELVTERVEQRFGVTLEPEVRILGCDESVGG